MDVGTVSLSSLVLDSVVRVRVYIVGAISPK